ncbi:MAG: hypothetical protein JWO68_2753 [Actinomycetia bacterium]|nr:hypothetical protein [Actinomycetes bacterium]
MPDVSLAARTAAAYDRMASSYATNNVQPPADVARLREVVVGRVGAGGLVLDVGCGPGRDVAWFVGAGLVAIGLDRSTVMLRLAEPATVARADFGALPFPDAAFAAVWSAASLLHAPSDDLAGVLAEWRRVLPVGGTLAVVTTVGGDEGLEIVPHADRATGAYGRWFAHHDEARLLAALAAAGFAVVTSSARSRHRRWISIVGEAVATPERTRDGSSTDL